MDNPTGYIVFGPKETIRDSMCAQVFYTPTDSQIVNMRNLFGWDFVTFDEANQLLRGK